MQQVIYLESHDLLVMKTGKTIQLSVGGTTIMLGYMGRTYRKNGANGHAKQSVEGEPMMGPQPKRQGHRPWNKGMTMKKGKKLPCTICRKLVHPMGLAPHMGMHSRNGELGDVNKKKAVA